MNGKLQTFRRTFSTTIARGVLQRACACGQHTVAAGECAECHKKREAGTLQRIATQPSTSGHQPSDGPPIVHEVLRSPGQPLDAATRAFMEPRFGHDFSQVRVHTDSTAVESARRVNASAYTVGQNVIFGAEQFAPRTATGRRLLAHELAHTIQQRGESSVLQSAATIAPFDSPLEREAESAATKVMAGENLELRYSSKQQVSRSPNGDTDEGTESWAGGGGRSGGGGADGNWDNAVPKETQQPDSQKLEGDEAQSTVAVGGRVKRIVLATEDGIILIETGSMSYLYELDSWNIPEGTYTATITINGTTVRFQFGNEVKGNLFRFNFRINRGQENPATLLTGTKNVTVAVVPTVDVSPSTQPTACLLPMADKTLINAKTFGEPLFKPFGKNVEWTFARIPLGFLGWVDANAEAGVSVAGMISGGYGPGTLTNICFYRRLDRDRLAGSASFEIGAAISPSIDIQGKLRVSADYLGVASLVAAKLGLNAKAVGMLRGGIKGNFDVIYNKRLNKWALSAEALMSGSAGMKFTLTASAAIELLLMEVWSEKWNLVDHDFHIGWQGGLRIGTDTKPRFDFGTIGVLSGEGESNQPPVPTLPTATAPDPLAPATIDTDAITQTMLAPDLGDEHYREGNSEDDALPFVWYKTLEIYPRVVPIPRASSPDRLDREDGPTMVTYHVGRGANTVPIGVKRSNWPYGRTSKDRPGKTFLYTRNDPGDVEKNALRDVFNQRLLPAGQTLRGNGFDLDHVHEKQFGGRDVYSNLWPADYQENQLAGTRHDHQLAEYRQTVGAIDGRWFEIVEIRRASS